jgi:DNA-binding SARP family transcriptional activator
VRVLGGFEFWRDGELVVLPVFAQRLVAFLAVRARPQYRNTTACSLWLDTTEARACANLRTTLWKVRQIDDELVRVNGNYLSLDADVDLATLLGQAGRLISTDHDLARGDDRVGTLRADLLPDWDEEWILLERERLRQLRCHALEALCRRLSGCGRHAESVDAGQAAIAAEPLRESAQRALIGAHLAEGNLSEARRQLAMYRELLWSNLGVLPAADLHQMVGWSTD